MACFKARCNVIGSVWYTLIVVALQAYLVYLGVERYRLYTDMKWPSGGYPSLPLTIYASLYFACLPLLLFLFAFGVFKSGNIAGDNERLADREERTVECWTNKNGDKRGCLHGAKSIWQHCPPLPQQIHVIVAMLQCVAQQIMIAQLYKNGFINSGDFLNTEMDFLFQRSRQLATNLPLGDTNLQGFRITADELSGSPLAPNLLPLLMHVRLFGIPLEFVNLCLALVMYTIAYSSVFNRVSKCFSFLFSLHLAMNSVCLVFSYLSWSVLYRIEETNIDNPRPVGLGQYLVHLRQFRIVYHPLSLLTLFAVTFLLMAIAPITLYAYGYCKYLLNVLNCQAKNCSRGSSQGAQSEYSTYNRGRGGYRSVHSQFCCDGHGPHIAAIVLLAMIAFVKAPSIYALTQIYQHEDKAFLLVCIVIEIAYLFSWILLWFGLTLRREWNFKVLHRAHEIYALQKGMTTGPVRLNTNPSQLKNALILVHRDQMYVTDDQNAKQSLLRAIQQNNFDAKDETYWLKSNGGNFQGSPSMKRVHNDVAALRNDEMNRLLSGGGTLRRQSHDDPAMYQSVNRQMMQQGQLTTPGYRGNSSPPHNDGTGFGTLQRNQQQYGIQRHGSAGVNQTGTLQRNMMHSGQQQWNGPTESYASIHKPKEVGGPYGRRGSHDENNGFSSHSAAYGGVGQYATYSRIPPQDMQQSRLGGQSNGGSTLRMTNSTYASNSQVGYNKPPIVTIPSVRQSPLIGDRSATNRESSPYAARTTTAGVKLGTFNNMNGGEQKVAYGSVGGGNGWASQRAPAGQPSQLLYNGPKPVPPPNATGALSNSSSQQDAAGCFTPNSTLTSQGSNYSERTPTRGSPQHSVSFQRNGETEEILQDGTLQRAPPKPAIVTGSTSVRHTVKVVGGSTVRSNDDSANFSLASSNGTSPPNDYATSIV